MDFIILKVNGEDVQNCSHEEAMEVFQRAPDPTISVEVMRRPQSSAPNTSNSTTKTPSVFPTPQVGGGGGLLQSGSSAESQISSIPSVAKQSVAVQTVLSAGEMAASLALAAASLAQQEARLALFGESGPYCTSGNLYGIAGVRDCVEDEECLEDEENGGDDDDAVFGIDEVGCLDYLLKRYPYNCSNPSSILPPFCNHPNAPFGPVMDSVYANFPDNPNSASSGFGNLPPGDYTSTSSEKCFEVILQKQSPADKFGLTLCYRPSDVQHNVTEVYISEIEPGSVAHRSGQIMLGDRLVKIGDQEITSREHVMDLFQGCGLCVKIAIMRQQQHWKHVSNRLPLSYPPHSYPDSTLDIGISNTAYVHLPDQDSGMGRTTDDSVRTEESSEQEVDEHKALLMNAWSLFDPTGGVGGGIPVSSTAAAPGSNSHPQAFLPSGIPTTNSNHLDNELIHLSQLMQSLAMHCHKLALEKMCGTRGIDGGVRKGEEGASAISAGTSDIPPVPPTESGVTESSSTDLVGDGEGLSSAKTRQTPRMGLGATSNKTSSANSLSKFKGSSDVSGGDFYEAVVMPKQSGDLLTLCLTQRQPHQSPHLPPQYDLDPSDSHAKGHSSMPPTNPSSIWSIAETDKEPPSSQASSNRFNAAPQFLNHGSRSSHIGSTSSCERPESSTSFGEIPGCKPPIPPSNGGSLNGSKLSCGSLNSGNSSLPVSSHTPNSTPSRVGPGIYENHATANPAYMMGPMSSSSMFLPTPRGFLHSPTPPYEFYDRYFKNGLPHPHNPHLHLPPPPVPGTPGLVPNFRYPPPLRPQTWMCSGKVPNDASDDRRKDDTTSSNIYETPYAEVDIINGPSKPPNGDSTGGGGGGGGGNDTGNVCFTSYGVINSPYGVNNGQTNRCGGESLNRNQSNSRSMMEWVVKKRADGTRYITRRPVRSRQAKERSNHRRADTGEDEKGDETGARHHSKGDRRRPPEQGVDRAGSRHRRRGTPTRQSNSSNQPQSSTNARGLVSLTTV